jgi:hypothetical protein
MVAPPLIAEAGDARLKPLTLDSARVDHDIRMNTSKPPAASADPAVRPQEFDRIAEHKKHTIQLVYQQSIV